MNEAEKWYESTDMVRLLLERLRLEELKVRFCWNLLMVHVLGTALGYMRRDTDEPLGAMLGIFVLLLAAAMFLAMWSTVCAAYGFYRESHRQLLQYRETDEHSARDAD
jgi:hypothetical protein